MRWAIAIGAILLAAAGGWLLLGPSPGPTGREERAAPPALATPTPSPEPDARELGAGAVVRRDAAPDDVHRYDLRVAEGEFLAIDVEQQGVDVALELRAPGGDLVTAVDSPNGERGSERLQALAGASGLYRVEIAAAGPAGTYTLRVAGPRPASAEDRRLAAAADAYFAAETLRRRGKDDLPAALTAYRHALGLARRAGDLHRQALVLRRVGQVAESLDRRGDALAAFGASLDLYRRCDDRWEEALLFYSIGRLHRLASAQSEALAAYTEALVRFGELGDASRQASALNDLGLIHTERAAMQQAIDCYRSALVIWRRTGNLRSEAITLTNLGEVYASMRYNERAAKLFRQALALHRRTGEEAAEAAVLDSLGTVQRRMGAHREALAAFAHALRLMRRHHDRHGEAIVLNSQGATLFRLGDFDQARSLYRQAFDLAQQIDEPGTAAYARVNLGWLDETQGSPASALDHHRAALATFRELGDVRGETSALFGVARAERRRGRLPAARASAEAALAKIELLRSGVEDEGARSAFLADRHSYFEFLVDLLMEMGEPAVALEVSERGRARVLLDLLRSGRVDLAQGVAPDLLQREREVAAQLQAVELERLRRSQRGRRAETADLDAALTSLTEELHDLRGRVRTQNPSYAALAMAEVPALAEVRRQLGDDTLLLEISLGEERSFLWLIGRRLLVHRVLPARREIEAQARRARRLLQQSHVPLYRRQLELVLQDLGRTLLGPIAGRLDAARLVVVADGELQLFPFAVLPVPATATAAAAPLITRHEIVQLPSIAVLQVLRDRGTARPPAAKTLAVFGDPVFHRATARRSPRAGAPLDDDAAETGFSPTWFRSLPSSRREAEAILGLVPPDRRLAALGRDARLDRVLGGELRDFRILHFATHGLLNDEHPELSGIALSQVTADGTPRGAILWAHQIYGLDLPVELVVLSACQTALGKEVRGEGVIGLTRGFMHAGATRVVVSLWNVSDEATAELMTRFYQALLRQGMPAAAALREAQLSLREERRWSSPYHWAGFVLQGDWR
jgi:CHAT domain-containing protein/Tfp pilus assembly protein PilF